MSAVVHGGIDYAELAALGISPAEVLDFSSNINPFGPPEAVRRALATLNPAPYPDRAAGALRSALAARYGCSTESALVGNGSLELIHLIARAMLRPGDRVLVVEPTFGEYAHVSRLAGAMVTSVWSGKGDQFEFEIGALLEHVALERPRLVWLCAPNNPAGVTLDEATLLTLGSACRAAEGFLVVDRAYAEMQRGCTGAGDTLAAGTEMLMLHSLTKTYALAGLRLGCLVGPADLIARITVFQPTWSVNSAAQVAGLAAVQDQAFLADTLPRLWASSDRLGAGLEELGLDVLPSSLPFFLVRTGDGARTRALLLHEGCLVRDCASFGLPSYVRVAPRMCADNRRLIATWRRICQHQ